MGLCKESNSASLINNTGVSSELEEKLLGTATATEVDPIQFRQLPSSVLDNKLGAGGYKEALAIDDKQVFLIPKRDSTCMNPAPFADIKKEASDLGKVKELGLPVVPITEFGEVTTPDGEVIQGGIQERMLFNGLDIGINIKIEEVENILFKNTLDELEKIYDTFEEKGISIKDLQFMYGKDGLPRVADPQSDKINASHDDVDEGLNDIAVEYDRISEIINSEV